MMFKTKEELMQKNKAGIKTFEINEISCSLNTLYNDGLEKGIEVAFQDFAERVEFYKKYYNHRELFQRDCPNEWDKSIDFNWWLFDYCFGEQNE